MYHIALSLTNKKVTIIGGGKVAYQKVESIRNEKCTIFVIAPEFIKEFHRLDGNVHKIYKRYEKGDCVGSALVFVATDDNELNKVVKADCQRLHILCNVVDNKELSDFYTPAQIMRGDLTLSVSTNGKSPLLSQKIKNELASQYDDTYQEKVELLGQIRTYLLEHKIEDRKERLKALINLNNEALKEYLNQLDEEE